MVRLKGKKVQSNFGFWLFQFHYGTIKRTSTEIAYIVTINFNSTMVRLKDTNANESTNHEVYFNSTMVRLKAAGSQYY